MPQIVVTTWYRVYYDVKLVDPSSILSCCVHDVTKEGSCRDACWECFSWPSWQSFPKHHTPYTSMGKHHDMNLPLFMIAQHPLILFHIVILFHYDNENIYTMNGLEKLIVSFKCLKNETFTIIFGTLQKQ